LAEKTAQSFKVPVECRIFRMQYGEVLETEGSDSCEPYWEERMSSKSRDTAPKLNKYRDEGRLFEIFEFESNSKAIHPGSSESNAVSSRTA
jgi:hypothetical protein